MDVVNSQYETPALNLSDQSTPDLKSPNMPPAGLQGLMQKPIGERTYRRVWRKGQIKQLYNTADRHAQAVGKSLGQLDWTDFISIGQIVGQDPNVCMKKILEIQANGTLRPGVWQDEEDKMLNQLIKELKGRWSMIAERINNVMHGGVELRSGKQCKERWFNHLNPDIKRGNWTPAEDLELLLAYRETGNSWSKLARKVSNRTESGAKNRLKSLLTRQNVKIFGDQSEMPIVDQLIESYRNRLNPTSDSTEAQSEDTGRNEQNIGAFGVSFAPMSYLQIPVLLPPERLRIDSHYFPGNNS